jgi:hypothetical protein
MIYILLALLFFLGITFIIFIILFYTFKYFPLTKNHFQRISTDKDFTFTYFKLTIWVISMMLSFIAMSNFLPD